jgi:hypothetical protein
MCAESKNSGSRRDRHPAWRWIKSTTFVLLALAATAILIAIHYAEPILRTRVIETLSARFHNRVELASFHVSIAEGLQASGGGLKIFGNFDPNIHQPGIQPVIAVQEFRFRAGLLNLLHTPMRIHRVYLKGLELNIPPSEQRDGSLGLKKSQIKIYVDEFICEQLSVRFSPADSLGRGCRTSRAIRR